MNKFLIFLFVCLPSWGADIYFAQSSAGANNGTNCANAFGQTRFNTADANWTAGNTLHLCGSWTGGNASQLLSTHGNGSSGNPITIKFESGANLTVNYCATTGCFQINNNFITVDGGVPCGPSSACWMTDATGLITATANTETVNHADSEGLHIGEAGTPHDVEIKNIAITNMCVRSSGDADNGCTGSAIRLVAGCNNIQIHDSVFHDVNIGTFVYHTSGCGASVTGGRYYNNVVYNRNEAARYAVDPGVTITDCQFHDWNIGASVNWDDPADNFHHDGIHFFNVTDLTGAINGCIIYNNYLYGNLGIHATSGITFLEVNSTSMYVFNNLAIPTGAATDGLLFCATHSTHCATYNNTIIGNGGNGITYQNSTNGTIENNNITGTLNDAIFLEDTTSRTGITINNNNYFGNTGWDYGAGQFSTFSGWKTGCSCDSASAQTNPLTNSDGTLQIGSPAIGAALNLTSLGVTQLDTDRAGVARPSGVTPWDEGAYQVSGITTPTVTTTSATSITSSTAVSGGTVTSNGGASVTSEGVCYAVTSNPTVPCTSDGTATSFTSNISGLSSGTLYHYRAFATNSVGTGYGSDLTFTTASGGGGGVGTSKISISGSIIFQLKDILKCDLLSFSSACPVHWF